MKQKFAISVLTTLFLFTLACEERSRQNPFDPGSDLDPSEWSPSNLQTSVLSDTDIKLTWEQNEKLITGFIIERSNDDSVTWIQIAILNSSTTEYVDTGLSLDDYYIYRICAYASNNQSDYAISNQTNTNFPSPANLIATAQNDSEIVLEWVDNCDFEEGYQIERSDDGSIFTQIALTSANVIEYTDGGLMFGTDYLYRVRAYTIFNQSTYSNVVSPAFGVIDIDGNAYQTIQIGNQWWMAENLKVTHYRNGDAIPNVTDATEWSNLTTGAYCEYDNNSANVDTYGRLYNWYAVNDSRNIAPEGWHVPTDDEWQTLVYHLGGWGAGGRLKEAGTAHWNSPNEGATNESGFTALPGGYRQCDHGYYDYMGNNAYFWSATGSNSNTAWIRRLNYDYSGVYRYDTSKSSGFSVRCLRD